MGKSKVNAYVMDEMLELRHQGKNNRQIAEVLGISSQTVRAHIGNYRAIRFTLDQMMRMREDGMTNREIADKIGISTSTVLRYIGKGIRKPGNGAPVRFDKEEMRRLRDHGLSNDQIAQKLGCSKTTVWKRLGYRRSSYDYLDEFKRLNAEGKSLVEIGHITGFSDSTVRERLGSDYKSNYVVHDSVTPYDAKIMCDMYREGWTYGQIAKKTGYSVNTISKHVHKGFMKEGNA